MANPTTAAPPSVFELADAAPISPIACAFGLETLLGSIMDLSDLAGSYGRSAAEAAWRGDLETLGAHLRQAINAIKAALMILEAVEGGKAKASDTELAQI